MIEISAKNEDRRGFDLEIALEGKNIILMEEFTAILDEVYLRVPKIFEAALLKCKYTEDHV